MMDTFLKDRLQISVEFSEVENAKGLVKKI